MPLFKALPTGTIVGTTDTQTLTNKTLGTTSVAGNFTVTGSITPAVAATTTPSISNQTVTPINVANGGSATVPTTHGFYIIRESSTGSLGVYISSAGATTLIGTTSSVWVTPTTTPAAGKASLAYDGTANIRIYNNIGSAVNFYVYQIQMA